MKGCLTRKWLACLVLLALAVSVSACASGDGKRPERSANEDKGTAAGQSAAEADRQKAEEPFRYSTMASTFAEVPDMNNQFWSRFQQENNVKLDIQWIPSTEFITKLNLAIASGELPDVVSVDTNDINVLNAIQRGVFWDLGPFLGDLGEYPNLKRDVPEKAWQYAQIDGTNYYIPRSRPMLNIGYMIRKDLLDEAGVAVPQTVDELRDALNAIKTKTAAGKEMLGTNFYDGLASAFGTFTPQYNDEGGMYRDVLSDAYTSMVEWYRQVYADGLMTPEFSTMTFMDNDNFFTSGKTAFHFKNFWHQYEYEQDIKKVKADAEVEIIPYLSGPGGTSYALEPGFQGGLLIPKKVPEARVKQILAVLERIGSPENSDKLLHGYEGVHYNLVDGKYVMTDIGLKEIQSFTMDPFTIQRNEWDKVDSPLAPLEVDQANREKVKPAYDKLQVNPFGIIRSTLWAAEWTKYADEFVSMRTKAIMGLVSMDEYRTYIDTLRNNPGLKKAFVEMADSYKEIFE